MLSSHRLRSLVRRLLTCHVPVNQLTKPLFRFLYVAFVVAQEGFGWLKRLLWNEPLFRSACAAVGSHLQMEQLPYIVGSGEIVLGDYVRLSGKSNFLFASGPLKPSVVIGSGTFVGHNCTFAIRTRVTIGENCLLAGGVRVSDHDGHHTDAELRRAGAPDPLPKPVIIGHDVWIGASALVLKGVHLGDRVVVGAGAVVTKDVPADCIAVGNPARVIERPAVSR